MNGTKVIRSTHQFLDGAHGRRGGFAIAEIPPAANVLMIFHGAVSIGSRCHQSHIITADSNADIRYFTLFVTLTRQQAEAQGFRPFRFHIIQNTQQQIGVGIIIVINHTVRLSKIGSAGGTALVTKGNHRNNRGGFRRLHLPATAGDRHALWSD